MSAEARQELLVGIAQWLPQPDDPNDAFRFIDWLGAERCELVVLPELWPCAYDPADPEGVRAEVERRAEPLDGPRVRALAEAARRHDIWLAAGSVPERTDSAILNTALLFAPDGTLRARHSKVHLYRPMHEDLTFAPGSSLTVCDTELLGRAGILVCFDGDFPESARALRRVGARVVIQVNAYEEAAQAWWDRIYPAQALCNGQWWIMANQCGTQGKTTFLGGSRIISPFGEVLAEAVRAEPRQTPEPEVIVERIELGRMVEQADAEAAILVPEPGFELPVELNGEISTMFHDPMSTASRNWIRAKE